MGNAWRGSTRRSRLPSDWAARRRAVLVRDRGRCHVCGKPGATEVDHVQPGDDHSLTNLAAIHRTCHATKSAREGGQAAWRNRPPRRRPAERHPGSLHEYAGPPRGGTPRGPRKGPERNSSSGSACASTPLFFEGGCMSMQPVAGHG